MREVKRTSFFSSYQLLILMMKLKIVHGKDETWYKKWQFFDQRHRDVKLRVDRWWVDV
jgi:hypothetical protein